MKVPRATFLIVVVLIVVIAGSVAAHDGDGDTGNATEDHMHDGDHMAGWWSMGSMGAMSIGYWVIAVPIGLLVYIDADRRRMNAPLWFLLILIPWIGIGAAFIYVLVRRRLPTSHEYYDDRPRMPPIRDYDRGW
jgi:putative membrane protein